MIVTRYSFTRNELQGGITVPDTRQGGIELFTFSELWSPFLAVFLFIIAFLYMYAIKKIPSQRERVPIWKKFLFIFGLVIFYVAQGSPLSLIGQHYLFSAHMVTMALTFIAVPPLILGGIPASFIRPLFQKPMVVKIVRWITNPIIVVLLFTGLYSVFHLPELFHIIMTNPLYLFIAKCVLLFVSFSMWWLLVNPLPEEDRLSNLQKLAVIFANGALLTPLAALIIFSESVLYSIYAEAHRIYPSFQPLDDQQTAGILMRIVQEIVFATMLAVLFFKWARKEHQHEQSETTKHAKTNEPITE